MSVFLLFSVLGFVLYLVAASLQLNIPKINGGVHPGGHAAARVDSRASPQPGTKDPAAGSSQAGIFLSVRNLFLDSLVFWALTSIAMAVIISFFFYYTVWDALKAADSPETPFLEFMGSRYIGSALFGLIFGTLACYWFSSVLKRDPADKPATFSEVVYAVLMLILLGLGLAGQDALSRMFSRVTSFEFAGAKLGLTAVSTLGEVARVQSPGGRSSASPPDESYGLQMIADVRNAIMRDYGYINLVTKEPTTKDCKGKYDRELCQMAEEADQAFGLVAACLELYASKTLDYDRLGRHLSRLTERIRRSLLGAVFPDEQWDEDYWMDIIEIKADSAAFTLNDNACKVWNSGLSKFPLTRINGQWMASDAVQRQSEEFKKLIWKQTPYLTIIYASALAYNHQYMASIKTLDDWLKIDEESNRGNNNYDFSNITDKTKRIESIVFRIRVRNLIAIYLEEWTRGTYSVKTNAVTRYKLDNLSQLADDLENSIFALSTVSLDGTFRQGHNQEMIGSKFERTVDGICSMEHEAEKDVNPEWALKLSELQTLWAAKLNWVTVALEHPDYDLEGGNLKSRANKYITQLLDTDFSCLTLLSTDLSKTPAFLKRAESLEAYGRLIFADYAATEKERELEARDHLIDRLDLALKAVKLGEIFANSASSTASVVDTSFSGRVNASGKDADIEGLREIELVIRNQLAQLGH